MRHGFTFGLVALAAVFPSSAPAEPLRSVLRLATSDDGFTFGNSESFLKQAASPDLLRLPNGHYLAVFEHVPASGGEPRLYVSRSTDGARSWSEAIPIVLRGRGVEQVRLDRPALALVRNGLVRLYFRAQAAAAGSGREPAIIGSAVTRDGIEYELDRDVQLRIGPAADVELCAAWFGARLHLFIVGSSSEEAAGRQRSFFEHWSSSNGREFYRLKDFGAPSSVSSIVPVRQGVYRAFTSSGGEVRSLLLADGSAWKEEAGARMINASSPAVTRLEDGRYLMIYCREMDPASQREPDKVAAAIGGPEGVQGNAGAGGASSAWQAFAAAPGAGGQVQTGETDPNSPGDPFPPKPDFKTRFDYVAWAQENLGAPIEGNAHDVYASFCQMPGDPPGAKPLWPDKIDDMFNGDYAGKPFAWDPAQNANWEASHQQTQPLRDKFREAVQFDAYRMPFEFTPEQYEKAGGQPRVFELLLPSLSQHRSLVKLTMSDAWRAENGQFSPENMMSGMETALRGAAHMLQGPTLIHRLVGVAEQVLVENTARQALATGAFSEQQLQAALDTLSQHDRPARDPSSWVQFEHAAFMDALQSLVTFSSGSAQVSPAAFKQLSSLGSGSNSQNTEDDLAIMAGMLTGAISVESFKKQAEAGDRFYRQMAEAAAAGYPQFRRAEVDKYGQQAAESGTIARMFVPNLGRAHQLIARNEANRRATQLSYALHLYHARNGQWPTSLQQLGPEVGGARIDPFTGNDFGYQLTAEGPRLYSLAENATDDGGIHSKWDPDKGATSDDYVFWPPQEY